MVMAEIRGKRRMKIGQDGGQWMKKSMRKEGSLIVEKRQWIIE